MNIAIFSEYNADATSVVQILTKYASKSPDVIFPVTTKNQEFASAVAHICKTLGITTTAYTDHTFTLANETIESIDPVREVLHQLEKGDAVGIVWTDGQYDHDVLHSVEDLALDVWDITEGLAAIEHASADVLSPEVLRSALLEVVDELVDLFSAYIATTVMQSLNKAVVEYIEDALDNKDISPFDNEE